MLALLRIAPGLGELPEPSKLFGPRGQLARCDECGRVERRLHSGIACEGAPRTVGIHRHKARRLFIVTGETVVEVGADLVRRAGLTPDAKLREPSSRATVGRAPPDSQAWVGPCLPRLTLGLEFAVDVHPENTLDVTGDGIVSPSIGRCGRDCDDDIVVHLRPDPKLAAKEVHVEKAFGSQQAVGVVDRGIQVDPGFHRERSVQRYRRARPGIIPREPQNAGSTGREGGPDVLQHGILPQHDPHVSQHRERQRGWVDVVGTERLDESGRSFAMPRQLGRRQLALGKCKVSPRRHERVAGVRITRLGPGRDCFTPQRRVGRRRLPKQPYCLRADASHLAEAAERCPPLIGAGRRIGETPRHLWRERPQREAPGKFQP